MLTDAAVLHYTPGPVILDGMVIQPNAQPDSPAVADLMALLDVSRQLAAPTELSPLLKNIAHAGRSILDCERATVFLYDADRHELYSSFTTEEGEIRFNADLGIAGEALRSGRVISVPNAYADPRFNREIDRRTGFHTRNMITFPLVGHDNRVVGALQVLNKRSGDFNERDEQVAATLSSLAGIAVQRQMLMDEYAEKQKLERDLSLARRIQQSLLPEGEPQLSGFDIAGFNQPADQTGGDSFDYVPLGDNQLGVIIADATGHGIGPALLVAQLRAVLRTVATMTTDPADVLIRVNELLYSDMPDGMFVTTFFALLAGGSDSIAYCSAGHGPILILRRRTGERIRLSASTVPLGVLPRIDIEPQQPVSLEAGDILLLVTDGFFEAISRDGEQFGVDRLFDIVTRHADEPADTIIQRMVESLNAFTGGTPQADDLTAVLVRRRA